MDPDRLRTYLDYIVQEAAVVQEATRELSKAAFEKDPIVRRAVERSIETIGEAVSKVRPEFEPRAPQLPWREVVGMRNILAHVYWDIDTDIVWEAATVHLPELAGHLARLRSTL